jgi:hypothetical protein
MMSLRLTKNTAQIGTNFGVNLPCPPASALAQSLGGSLHNCNLAQAIKIVYLANTFFEKLSF